MTFVKPPLPATEYQLAIPARPYEPEWISSMPAFSEEQMQARDAEMLKAVSDWLQQRAGQLRISEGALVLAECSTALRRAAEQ